MKIAIRADASVAIGTGHIRRMLSLAKALRTAANEVHFVTRPMGVDTGAMIRSEGFAALMLPTPGGSSLPDPAIPHSAWSEVSQQQDIADTVAALTDIAPDRVVVDSYAFDVRWHTAVSNALGSALMVVDDLADRALGGRWVLDHNYHPDHQRKYSGRFAEATEMLAGPSFALIDPAYATAPRYQFHDDVRSIGIFMGGVDRDGDTLAVLDALEVTEWKGPVEVVVTAHTPSREEIAGRLAEWPHGVLSQDLPNLAGFFARHDLQIGAGGGAIWERCCIGPPTIGMVCADNQAKSIPYADTAGFLVGIDDRMDPLHRRSTVAEAVRELTASPARRRALSATARRLVDGRGTERVVDALVNEE